MSGLNARVEDVASDRALGAHALEGLFVAPLEVVALGLHLAREMGSGKGGEESKGR